MVLFQLSIAFIFSFFFLANFWSNRVDDEGFVTMSILEIWYFRVATVFFLFSVGSSIKALLKEFLSFPFPKISDLLLKDEKLYIILIQISPMIILFFSIFFFAFLFIYTTYWAAWLFLKASRFTTKHKMFDKRVLLFSLSVSLIAMVLVSPVSLVTSAYDILIVVAAASLYNQLRKNKV